MKINHPGKFDDIITDDNEISKGVNTEKEKISSHHFRDTFISIALMSHIDPYMVMKWVGHSSYEMIKIYIKTPDEFDKGKMGKML